MNRIGLTALLALVLAAPGCSSDPTSPSGANVNLYLTDAPLDLTGVAAVNVDVDGFLLYPAGAGEEDDDGLPLGTAGPLALAGGVTVNLLDYTGGEVVLVATEVVPPGEYDRIRMNVSRAWLIRDDDGDPETPDIEEEIFIPSGKVDVPVPFRLADGETMEIVIDFDAQASVQVNATNGQHPYILRPVITPVGMGAL